MHLNFFLCCSFYQRLITTGFLTFFILCCTEVPRLVETRLWLVKPKHALAIWLLSSKVKFEPCQLLKWTKQKRYHKNVFIKKRSLDAGADLGWLDRFPKRAPRGHAPPENLANFNSLKSPHWNVLIMEVCMVGINLETVSITSKQWML